jgi:uncharacterized protein (TIGR03663 family)
LKSFDTRPLSDSVRDDLPLSEIEVESPEQEREETIPDGSVEPPARVEDAEQAGMLVAPTSREAPPPERKRFHFNPPSREQLIRWLPFWGMILLGALLRFWGLGDKPLHHDESLHAYYSLQLLNNLEHWSWCISPPPSNPGYTCYTYNPLLHGPFQFHAIALVYRISQLLGAPDNGVNTTTVRIAAATLGTGIVGLPYFLRDYLGKWTAIIASFLLAVSPTLVYFSRFAREDIYFAFFTFLMIVGVARYVRDRKMRWLVVAAAGFAFAYATKESIFLMIMTFGCFLGALIVWELGLKVPLGARHVQNEEGETREGDAPSSSLMPKTFAPIFVIIYFAIAGIAGKLLLGWINRLGQSIVTPAGTATPQADAFVANLKQVTVSIIPWLGIALGVFVLILLFREMSGKLPAQGRRGLAKRVDPQRQPLLDSLVTMPWTHWFFALMVAFTIFLVLFTVVFTNPAGGIGDGIWQGVYYWIQQQAVARGNQPWYYYLMVIPLYEQIGVVFGVVGILRCIARPTRFRLFLVYWFLSNFFIYSWAAEKMPWLTIHITMPMMLLAALGVEPIVRTCVNFMKQFFTRPSVRVEKPAGQFATNGSLSSHSPIAPVARRRVGGLAGVSAFVGLAVAGFLLVMTVHNMYEVSYIHAADGPHEMLVYVQTTTDVNTVMQKVNELDQKFYGGHHQMPIALTTDATWPFAWYVRDYPNICFDYPTGCPSWPKNTPVIISGGDNPYGMEQQYGSTTTTGQPPLYAYHQYVMRSWWDEGYKPPPCIQTATNNCAGQLTYGGVGPLLWLSYGDNPPNGATFNLSLAARRIWNWEWNRVAFGSTEGGYAMVLFIRTDLSKTVAP